jgi:serine/threonine protein kinase
MISLHHHQKIMFNTSNNTLVLNFESVEFKTKKDVEEYQKQVTSHLETICKKKGKVDCVVNYSNFKVKSEVLEAFAEVCQHNSTKYYNKQTRYIPNEPLSQELKTVLIQKQVGNFYEEIIGNYVLKEKIGKGSFGVVRSATSLKTGLQVAVKILNKKDMDQDFEGLEHLKGLEIKIHKEVEHSNVAKLLECIETEEFIYMVMEYCSGGKIEKLVEYNHFEESRARKYFKDLVSATEYLHSKNICHRDLHLGNILLDNETDHIKLIDFGLSNYYSNNLKIRFRCGRAMYAAPEMLNGEGYFGPEIDIWALGVCLFVMLTGFVPFRFSANTINREFSFPLENEGLSTEVVDLVHRILVLDPNERLSIEEIKSHPWMLKL